MAKYDLLIKPSAVKEIEDLPRKDRARVTRKILQLANERRPHGSEKLSAEEKYRVRQGNYRVVYSVDDYKQTVLVVKVGRRKDVYR